MFRSLNTAATGMIAQQNNMDVVANNIANVNTTGFKKARAEFEDLMYDTKKEAGLATSSTLSPVGVQTGLGVKTSAITKDFTTGQSAMTSNPFDLLIDGAGFFQVKTPDGEIAYTRDGAFKKDVAGRFTDKNGNLLMPEVIVPEGSTSIEISPAGEVKSISQTNDPVVIGQIELANFINPAGLKSVGKNLFTATSASGPVTTSRPGTVGSGFITQGQLETSNVNIVDEMINMISAQRAYETNSKVVQTSDQMLQTAVNVK